MTNATINWRGATRRGFDKCQYCGKKGVGKIQYTKTGIAYRECKYCIEIEWLNNAKG